MALDEIESFYSSREADTMHETCPLARRTRAAALSIQGGVAILAGASTIPGVPLQPAAGGANARALRLSFTRMKSALANIRP